MKSAFRSLVVTGVLALASTSLYAGEKANCQSSANSCNSCQSAKISSKADCNSSKWNDNRRVTTNTRAERPGYFQTSKGERFCTAKAMRDHSTGYTTVVRRDSRDWNKEVESSKNNPMRNPS